MLSEKYGARFVFDTFVSTGEVDEKLGEEGGVVITSFDIKVLSSVNKTQVDMNLFYKESDAFTAPRSPPVP